MALQDWTVSTLKEFFEARFSEIDRALALQAKEYERRLEGLNGEQARIAKSQSTYVGRELWDRSQEEDREWKRKTSLAVVELLTKQEFQAYKEATNKALELKAGQSQGIGTSVAVLVQVISSVASVAAIIGVIVLVLKR